MEPASLDIRFRQAHPSFYSGIFRYLLPLIPLLFIGWFILCLGTPQAQAKSPKPQSLITLDFSDVEIPVLTRFISELTGENFVLDEKVKGKISLFSPSKVTPQEAYRIFLSAIELKGYRVVKKGRVRQIVKVMQAPPQRHIFMVKLKNADVVKVSGSLSSLISTSAGQEKSNSKQQRVIQGDEFEAPVKVFSDAPTNSLIITATRRDYQILRPIIKKLDVRRYQVFVEGVILEVSVDRLRELGSDPDAIAIFKEGPIAGAIGLNSEPLSSLSAISGAFTGLSSGLVSLSNFNLRAFLKVLLTSTDVNVLATPQILTLDNVQASINVGENRPFVTGSGTVGATGSILTTVERKDVGVSLEITPHLLEDDMIRLEVKQEITAVTNDPQVLGEDVAVGPTTTKRSATTTILARNGQTVALGGLIREDTNVTRKKIPLLGDIPIVGWFFKSDNTTREKLNLLLFLTPTIVKDSLGMNRLVEVQKSRSEALREDQLSGKNMPKLHWDDTQEDLNSPY